MLEFAYLAMPEDEWQRLEITTGDDGRPLAAIGEDGVLQINDPLIAKWDAEARANAGLPPAGGGDG